MAPAPQPTCARPSTLGATLRQAVPAPARLAVLLERRNNVLRLLAQGLDKGAIARRFHKSEKTACNQVSSVFDKLGVCTRTESIVHARDRDARP